MDVSGMLEGKVVAVTGAGRGIGREIALLCAAEGASVVVNDPGVGGGGEGGDAGPAQETVDDIVAAGGKGHANLASVADPAGAASIVEDAVSKFGRIDAVVNNAGILRDTIWHKMSHEDWRAVLDVHLNGCFNVSKAATPYFREQESGSFVHFNFAIARITSTRTKVSSRSLACNRPFLTSSSSQWEMTRTACFG